MLVLLAVLVLVGGFAARLNPLMVVVAAALAAGMLAAAGAGGVSPQTLGEALVNTVRTLGHEFTRVRYVSVIWLILPVIGLLEREGLQARARRMIGGIRAATVGRLLIVYFLLRQATAALGLNAMMGHAQTVRPLLAPMAEGALEAKAGPLTDKVRYRLRAFAAATDNVAVFYGEDIFVAVSSILLIVGALQGMGVKVQPIQLSLWAIPSAICAVVVHGVRLLLLDRRLERELKAEREAAE
jgi:uncharacterized membrane protein